MVGMGLKRIARLIITPAYLISQPIHNTTGRYTLWYQPDPDQVPSMVGPYGDAHFPFPDGTLVEPDRP